MGRYGCSMSHPVSPGDDEAERRRVTHSTAIDQGYGMVFARGVVMMVL